MHTIYRIGSCLQKKKMWLAGEAEGEGCGDGVCVCVCVCVGVTADNKVHAAAAAQLECPQKEFATN